MSKAQQTRQFIIETMAPIFNRKGYFATSLSDITAATRLSKGSIYGNFRDKDEVALAAFEYNVNCLFDKIEAGIKREESAYGKIMLLIDFYKLNSKVLSNEGGCPLMNAAIEADDMLLFMRPLVKQSFQRWKKKFEAILKEGVANGEFRVDINIGSLSTVFLAMFEGAILLSKIKDHPKDLFTVLDKVKEMVDKEIRN